MSSEAVAAPAITILASSVLLGVKDHEQRIAIPKHLEHTEGSHEHNYSNL